MPGFPESCVRELPEPAEEAFILFLGIREMASTNLIARFESKLDAMRSELTMQRWLMGLGFAALVAAAIAQLFRG